MIKRFKYNLTLFYQSTIVYFVAFVLYVIIRGEFVEDSFSLILKDPILYAFAAIVIISTVALIYNIYRKRFIEFNNNHIIIGDKNFTRKIDVSEIAQIKIRNERTKNQYFLLKNIRIKLFNKKRIISIRSSDYENEDELIEYFNKIKNQIESKNV